MQKPRGVQTKSVKDAVPPQPDWPHSRRAHLHLSHAHLKITGQKRGRRRGAKVAGRPVSQQGDLRQRAAGALPLQQAAGAEHGHARRRGHLQGEALIGRYKQDGAPPQRDLRQARSARGCRVAVDDQEDASTVDGSDGVLLD